MIDAGGFADGGAFGVRVEEGRCGWLEKGRCAVVGVDVLEGVRCAGCYEGDVDGRRILGRLWVSGRVVAWWCAFWEGAGLLMLLLVLIVLAFRIGRVGTAKWSWLCRLQACRVLLSV